MILFSNDCPKCKVLKTLLNRKELNYIVSSDFQELSECGIMSLPVLKIDDGYLDFNQAVEYIQSLGGK